ncbi:MGH1-like glycoside hydrolase domain-containing protein [Georgenia daeguensis]|uniref:Trehalase family glycosidase n=1 Tax=Georgenia daeguensis TaxID=908355 RepID=A0ABP8EV44_9MICO
MRAAREAAPAAARHAALELLGRNWTGTHTVPAAGLYPHQWSWDSAFVAVGLRHHDPVRAQTELETLLAAQWSDGRVPQIVYDPTVADEYSPNAAFWGSTRLAAARGRATSLLVQPPVHAWAAWLVHTADPEVSRRRRFLERVHPRLRAWHEYLRRERDRGSGLAAVVHPWESGTDNSPLWDDALARLPERPGASPPRPDLAHADAAERPSDREYGRYFWLAEHYRDRAGDDGDPEPPFAMEDPAFNALWALSEQALAATARELGLPAEEHERRAAEILAALEPLFDPVLGVYVARDALTGELVRRATVSGLVPAAVPGAHHAGAVVAAALGPRFLGSGAALVPSYDATAPDLDRALYWRGPAWFNTTWLVAGALRRHGHHDTAARLGETMVRLAVGQDFPEYVDAWDGSPHGTRGFSWTAAVVLDVLATPTGDRRP